jgi:hypothetical protein
MPPRQSRPPTHGSPSTYFATVRALAAALPGVEEGTSYGTPALKVKGKLFARLREDGETLVLRTTPEDRELLLEKWPRVFYLTDHYRDYPWVLVRLATIRSAHLGAVLEDAWGRVAPLRLRKEREARREPILG